MSCSAVARLSAAAQNVPAVPGPAGRILVVPFENVTRDGRIFWLSEASAVLLTDDLNALGANAITREERRRAFDRLQVPAAPALTDATLIRIGQILGAAQVVIGSLELDGDALVVHARSIVLEAGRIQHDVTERGPVGDLFGTFERLAHAATSTSSASLRRRFQGAPPPLEHPVAGAFEDYIKGLLAAAPPTAINYLNAALQVQPTLDRARLALWDVYDQQGEHDRALAAVRPVPAASPWARRARFREGVSELNLKKYDDAFATFKAIADREPSAPVLNNLGIVQLRRGGTPQAGQATYFFDKAATADATDADYFFNLGYAYWSERDMPAAVYWLREAVRRNPADGEAHLPSAVPWPWPRLSSSGNTAEANREKELARRLSSTFAEWDKRPGVEAVPKGLERVKGDVELPHALRIDDTLANNQQLAGFYLDRARRLYQQENDRDALADLNRVIFLSPYQAEAHLLVGRIHLRGGQARGDRRLQDFPVERRNRRRPRGPRRRLPGGEGHRRGAPEAERALALDPASTAARQILTRLPGIPH